MPGRQWRRPPPREGPHRRGQDSPPTMFLSSIVLALVVGALAGGGLPRLADLRLRWLWLLVLALAVRFGAGLLRQGDIGTDLPLGALFIVAYGLIFAWLWGNWRVPGLQIAA